MLALRAVTNRTKTRCTIFGQTTSYNDDNANEILSKREPLVYTRARRVVPEKREQKQNKTKQKHARTVQHQ